jgi:nucleoside-diphosphate-sugar epimerase
MHTILITGATGSIGSRLIEYFLSKKIFHIIATTRSNHIKSFRPNLEYISLNEESIFDYSILCNRADFIIHLAARTEVEKIFYEQTTFSQINYTGTVKIQGSLSEGGTPHVWTDIESIALSSASQTYRNVTGKYNFFRIRHFPTTGTVDKVLYR